MNVAPTTSRRRTPALAWLPAALLLAWGVLAAAGAPIAPNSHAATTGSTSVQATVLPDISIGGTCIGGALSGATMNAADGAVSLGTCTVTQSTSNHVLGTTLKVESARPSGAAFCKNATATAACGAVATFTDGVGTAGAASLADGFFGVRVTAAQTCGSATWTNGNYYNLRDAGTAPGAGDTICSTPQATPGSYTLGFEANPSATQQSGVYYAQANFTVEAN